MTGLPALVCGAWRAMPRGTVRVTFLLGLGLFAYHVASRFGPGDFRVEAWPMWLGFMARMQLTAFAMLACVVLAERAAEGQPDRRAPYVMAVVVGASISALATWSLQVGAQNAPRTLEGWLRVLYFQIEFMVLGGAVVFLWLDRRRAQAALARMHAAQLRRVEAGRRTLESQLQAMQARVEPQFLFDTLARVRQLYDSAPDTGDRVLDELIAYLRAAMPRMRDTSSNVQQEVELVRAWLAIARDGTDSRIACAVELADGARSARLPPMLLLPLVERFVAQHACALRMEIGADRGRLRLRLEGDGDAPLTDDAAIAALRERLAVLHGNDATLAIAGAGGRAVALIDLPFETMPNDPATAGTDRSAS